MRPPENREGVSLVVRGLQNPSFCMKKPDKEQTSQSAPYPAVVSLNNAPAERPYSAGKGCFQDSFCFLNLGSQ